MGDTIAQNGLMMKERQDGSRMEEENFADFVTLFAPTAGESPNQAHKAASLKSLRCKRERAHAELDAARVLCRQMPYGGINRDKRARYSEDGLISSPTGVKSLTEPASSSSDSTSVTSPLPATVSTPQNALVLSPPLSQSGIRWTEKAVEQILASHNDPIGKFLRDLGITAADAIRLSIMSHLDQAPRKPRTGYGKRKDLPPIDRKAISRQRNREHAKSTRQRRKIFEGVLGQQLRKLGQAICSSFTTLQTSQYLQRRSRRVENLIGYFVLMNSSISPEAPVSWQYCIMSDVTTRIQLHGLWNLQKPGAMGDIESRVPYDANDEIIPNGGCGELPKSSGLEKLSAFSAEANSTPNTNSSLLDSAHTFKYFQPREKLPFSSSPNFPREISCCRSFSGFESLNFIMKSLLECLQRAVYHILLSNAFYRNVFDHLVQRKSKIGKHSCFRSPSSVKFFPHTPTASGSCHVDNCFSSQHENEFKGGDILCHPSSVTNSPNHSSDGESGCGRRSDTDSTDTPTFNKQVKSPQAVFSLQHLIPIGVRLLISNSKKDLLVQGMQAMCSFDVEIFTESTEEKDSATTCDVDTHIGEVHSKNCTAETGSQSQPNKSCEITKTLVNIPGTLATFYFDSDSARGSKIQEAQFSLDIEAVAMGFLDHVEILRRYFDHESTTCAHENVNERQEDATVEKSMSLNKSIGESV